LTIRRIYLTTIETANMMAIISPEVVSITDIRNKCRPKSKATAYLIISSVEMILYCENVYVTTVDLAAQKPG
jgi:Ca2+/H+ antiporter